MHTLNMCAELGVIAVSMVNLFSERQHPGHDSSGHQQQFSVMLVSIITTVGTFTLTMIGAGCALAGFKAVATRVSAAGSRAATAVPGGSRVAPITPPLALKHGGLTGVHRDMPLGT